MKPRDDTSIAVRPAEASEAAVIRQLVRRAGINPLGLKWQRFLVALNSEGGIIGCGQLKPHRDGSLELASLAVERDWRGQGVGTALIRQLIKTADQELWLMCRSPLTSLYSSFGFAEVKVESRMPGSFRRSRRLVNLVLRMGGRREYLAFMVRSREGEGEANLKLRDG